MIRRSGWLGLERALFWRFFGGAIFDALTATKYFGRPICAAGSSWGVVRESAARATNPSTTDFASGRNFRWTRSCSISSLCPLWASSGVFLYVLRSCSSAWFKRGAGLIGHSSTFWSSVAQRFSCFGRRLACLEFADQKHDGLSIREGAEGGSSVFIRVHLWLRWPVDS
jgi:hypothetical protein